MNGKRKVLACLAALCVTGTLCGLAAFTKGSYPTVTVQLPANAPAGYTWVCAVKPEGSFVTVDTAYAPDDADDPSAGGVQTFVLQSRAQGPSKVSFACVDGENGRIDSTASYEFVTDGSTIVSEGTEADISETLMAPFEQGGAAA